MMETTDKFISTIISPTTNEKIFLSQSKLKAAVNDVVVCLQSYQYFKRRLNLTDAQIRELSDAYHYDEQYLTESLDALVHALKEIPCDDEINALLKRRDSIVKDSFWVQSFYYDYKRKHPELIEQDDDELDGYE